MLIKQLLLQFIHFVGEGRDDTVDDGVLAIDGMEEFHAKGIENEGIALSNVIQDGCTGVLQIDGMHELLVSHQFVPVIIAKHGFNRVQHL